MGGWTTHHGRYGSSCQALPGGKISHTQIVSMGSCVSNLFCFLVMFMLLIILVLLPVASISKRSHLVFLSPLSISGIVPNSVDDCLRSVRSGAHME